MQHQESENLTSVRLEQYFLVLYRSKWSIFFILLLALMTAFIKNDTSQPVYQATVKLWVKQQDKGITGAGLEDVFMSGMLGRTAELETLCEIIRSPSTLERVIDDLALLDSPIPDHRGRFVAWFSQRLGIDLLNSVPEMSRDSYDTFRRAWVALEAPYLFSHLESFTTSQMTQSVELRAGEFDAIRTRLKRLGQLDSSIAGVSSALESYLEEEYRTLPYPSPTDDARALADIFAPLKEFTPLSDNSLYTELAAGIFQWRTWLDPLLTIDDHRKIRRQIKREGARAVYDQLTKTGQLGEANGTERPYESLTNGRSISFRDFQNYCMDPAFDYEEYQQLIQRQLQQREIEEEFKVFQDENQEHPDRSLWTEQDFADYYRRVQHEELLGALQASLSVQPSRDADVIQITVKAPSQERAVSIANRLATRFEEFMAGDARSRMQVTKSFAKDRGQDIDRALTKAAKELSDYQKEKKTIALSAEAEATIKGLSELELLRANAEARQESAQKHVDQLRTQLQQEDPTIMSSETLAPNQVWENAQFKLIEAQIELERLRAKYPDGRNPDITRQEAMIAQWEQVIDEEKQQQTTRTQSPNPLVASLTDQLVRAQSELLAAKAEITIRDAKIIEYNQRLQQMPETEKELARLKRIVLRYEVLSETLAQAEQEAEMLEQAEPSNIVAFQPASFRQQLLPISPRRPMNLMLGGLIGLALGVGLAFLREYLDNTYGTVEEAQRDLEFVSKRINPAVQPTFLTMVPAIDSVGGDRSYVITLKEPKSAAAEAFRIVRTKLQFMGTEAPVKCILVTSSTPGEGKSTISSNLAVALAQQMGKKVLLIDADLRKPVQHKIFADATLAALPGEIQGTMPDSDLPTPSGVAPQQYAENSDTYGLSRLLVQWRNMMSEQSEDSPVHQWLLTRKQVPDGSNGAPVLAEDDEVAACAEMEQLVQHFVRRVRLRVEGQSSRHRGNGQQSPERPLDDEISVAPSPSDVPDDKDLMIELDLIPSGPHPPNPSELLSSESMEQLLEYLRTDYDYIVVDSPPVKAAADPIILSSYVDTVVYTFDIVKTKRFDIRSALEELLEANPRNIGTLCNLTESQHGGYYGYGGRYGYNKYGYYYGRYRYGDYYSYYYADEKETQADHPTEE